MERGHHVRRLFFNFVIFQEMEIAERGEWGQQGLGEQPMVI